MAKLIDGDRRFRPDKRQIEMLRDELTKVRCWLSGWRAAHGIPGSMTAGLAGPPGEDALRQTVQLFDEILKSRTDA